jgi:hypothetical protein
MEIFFQSLGLFLYNIFFINIINVMHKDQVEKITPTNEVRQPPNEHEFEVVMLSMQMTANKDTKWYLDSSASTHVLGDSGSFHNVKKVIGHTNVKSTMGHIHKVQGKGNNVIVCQGRIKVMNIIIYVLGAKKNVLSIGAIANMGCVVIFGKISCWIVIVFTPHEIVVTSQRDLTNGLYKLTITTLQKVSQNSPTLLMTKHHLNINLWHKQLGHIGFQGRHELSREGYFNLISIHTCH